MENMENKMQTTELSPREEYHQEFLPQVHKIGATTMAIALILSLLPTIYFVFIKGIEVPLSTFISVMIAIFTFAIGMWLSEPAAFWPVLGSAGTYFAFLAGNASSMRLPVALTARSSPVRPISPGKSPYPCGNDHCPVCLGSSQPGNSALHCPHR